MMKANKLEAIRKIVKKLYEEKNPQRAEWADWLYENHVLVVANKARELAQKYNANPEIAELCALLHDIADTFAKRNDPLHEEKSLKKAAELLLSAGFSEQEIELIVNDALRFHSCHNGECPKSLEGKILSTADAYAHLETDFYFYAMRMFKEGKTFKESKDWVRAKLERDYHNKTLFEDERRAWHRSYEMFKELFSR